MPKSSSIHVYNQSFGEYISSRILLAYFVPLLVLAPKQKLQAKSHFEGDCLRELV